MEKGGGNKRRWKLACQLLGVREENARPSVKPSRALTEAQGCSLNSICGIDCVNTYSSYMIVHTHTHTHIYYNLQKSFKYPVLFKKVLFVTECLYRFLLYLMQLEEYGALNNKVTINYINVPFVVFYNTRKICFMVKNKCKLKSLNFTHRMLAGKEKTDLLRYALDHPTKLVMPGYHGNILFS